MGGNTTSDKEKKKNAMKPQASVLTSKAFLVDIYQGKTEGTEREEEGEAAAAAAAAEEKTSKMKLKVYADRLSQPSRAVIIFCKLNGIQFEEIRVDLSKRQHLSPEFKEINPMGKVPAIVDGRFKLFESHAILIYLACAFPGIPDHWYPNDLSKRAKIHSVLDWHHSNLRSAAPYVLNSVLAPAVGLPLNPQAAAEAEKVLSNSLSKLETFWLKGNGKFLLGSNQPSIADLSLVCEIMQLELLEEKDRLRLLGPHEKVQKWVENTRNATVPHFDDVHKVLFRAKERMQKQSETETGSKPGFQSKM